MPLQELPYDYAFIGMGCANSLILLELDRAGLLAQKRILVYEPEQKKGNDRTFCFWLEPNVLQDAGLEHTYRWFAGKEEFYGNIYNSAKYATFMNFEIRVTFLSETKTALSSKVYKLYKYGEPDAQVPFKIQAEAPSGYRYHRVELIRAIAFQSDEVGDDGEI